MIVAGVLTGVGFSNLKNFRTRIKKFWNKRRGESEKVTPAASDSFCILNNTYNQ